jgi:hypothetical protein
MYADTENIIKVIFWMVVFFIWILSRIVKFFRKKPEPVSPQKSKSGKKEAPRAKGLGEAFKESLRTFFEDIAESEKEEKSASKKEPVQREIPPPLKPPSEPEPERVIHEPVPSAQVISEEGIPLQAFLSGRGLQQAVVMSEILAPPVALRRDEKRF